MPKFELDEDHTILLCLYYLAASMFGPFVIPGLPAGLAKAGELLFTTNACVAVYALSVFFYSGRLSFTQQKLFFAGFGMLIIVNLASGWLHLVAYPVLAFLLGEMHLRKRLPLTKILVLALAFMVLEVAKEEFRREDWAGTTMGREVSSLSESFDTAARWTSFAPKSVDQLTEGSTDRILRRVSHLGFMADVARKTPDHIGYLMGYTYKSIPAMIVPRILWPEKPSTMDINNYLVVKYEWLPPFLVGKVAVSPGLMDEAFMNFGLTGVVFVMLTLGIFIRWLTTNLGDPQKGFGWQLALIGFMTSGGLMVTWTAQSYLAGLWQTVVFIAALYWPARKRHKEGAVREARDERSNWEIRISKSVNKSQSD